MNELMIPAGLELVVFGGMMFLDEETRNLREVGELGVTCVEVRSGMGWEIFERALGEFGSG